MRIEAINDQDINLDDFDRRQEVNRVYVNESGKLLLKDQIYMDWSPDHKRKVANNLKSDAYIAYVARESKKLLVSPSGVRKYQMYVIIKSLEGRLHVFGALPIFHGTDQLCSSENLGEITEGGKPQQLGNLGHGKVGFGQQVLALLDSSGDHVVDGGNAVLPFKCMGKIILVHVGIFSQLFQGQCLLKMQIDVSFDGSTLAVAGNHLGLCGDSKGSIAHQADDQNLHIGLADIFITGVLLFHFSQNISKTSGNFHTFKMIQDIELTVGIFAGCQLDALNAQNDIFQRLCVQTDLGMGDIGINDYKIVDIYRVKLILNQKLSFAAHNIE